MRRLDIEDTFRPRGRPRRNDSKEGATGPTKEPVPFSRPAMIQVNNKRGSIIALLAALGIMMAGICIAIVGFGHNEEVCRALILISAVPFLLLFLWPDLAGTFIRRRRFRRFADLDDDALYSIYREDGFSKALVCGLRNDLADAFGLPPAKLHPQHKFINGPFERPGIELVSELHELVEDAVKVSMQRTGLRPDTDTIDSVDAYIRAFCQCPRVCDSHGRDNSL